MAGLLYECLITKMILVVRVPLTKEYETIKYISDLSCGTIDDREQDIGINVTVILSMVQDLHTC